MSVKKKDKTTAVQKPITDISSLPLEVQEKAIWAAKKILAEKPPKYVAASGGMVAASPEIHGAEMLAKVIEATGVPDQRLSAMMLSQAAGCWDSEDHVVAMNHAAALLHSINPQNALEGTLAVQMAGVHALAMKMMRRANDPEQTTDGVDRNINRATKLMRTFTAQADAFQRLRGKGQQTVRVEHVTVNAGGQAIVGHVEHQGGGGKDGK